MKAMYNIKCVVTVIYKIKVIHVPQITSADQANWYLALILSCFTQYTQMTPPTQPLVILGSVFIICTLYVYLSTEHTL
jgi:hypothetical protein